VRLNIKDAARDVMDLYPRIFFACHQRHVRDPRTRRLVSEHQASILAHLDEVHPLSLNALSAHMGVTAGTMSVAVSRLVTMGYIRRKRDPQDSRRLLLRLSVAGARVRDAQSVLEPSRVEAMLERLPADRLVQALEGLRLLAEAAAGISHARGGASGAAADLPTPEAARRTLPDS
jgi:MarR family transcriptional regulator, organic hydroperoxide resistance regulator